MGLTLKIINNYTCTYNKLILLMYHVQRVCVRWESKHTYILTATQNRVSDLVIINIEVYLIRLSMVIFYF